LCDVAFLCLVALLSQNLSSLRMSPISADNTLEVDVCDRASLTDNVVESEHSCTDQHFTTAGDCHVDCDKINEKVTVDVRDILKVNASNTQPLLSSSENPVTNLA